MRLIRSIKSGSAAQTRRIGETISKFLEEGDLVVLRGPLGSGKTTLVGGIAAGLGCPQASSPTFVLVKEYRGRKKLRHADFFRLDKALEVEDLGMEEIFSDDAVTVVEWPEPLIPLARQGYLEIELEFGPSPSDRIIKVSSWGAAFESRRDAIAEALEVES